MKKIVTRDKICIECGVKYSRPYGQGIVIWNKRKFCSHLCYSENLKGQKRKPHSASVKKKISKVNNRSGNGMYGKKAWNSGTKGICKVNKGSFRKGDFVGDKNCNWKGGSTSLAEKIRKCTEYKEWRKKIYIRDNFTCQMPLCKNPKKHIQAHHIEEFLKIINRKRIKTVKDAIKCTELWNLLNGIVLCRSCHGKISHHEQEYAPIFTKIVQSKLNTI